jgi:hypothetical protein
MAAPDDVESRVAALEARMGQVAAEAQVARQNAAAARRIDEEFRKVDNGFFEMRGKFDMTAAGLERIADLIEQRGEAG